MTVHAVAIIDSEGEIKQIYTPGGSIDPEGEYSFDKDLTVVHITTQVDQVEYMKKKYYKGGEWKDREDKSETPYFTWKDEAWVLDSTEMWKSIRFDRDLKLAQCDWTQIPDGQLTDEKKTEWVTYRQILRNLPADQSSVTDPVQVVWPDVPS
tara:strand:+ start:107 stop:562 length:456 start_codon:yes stop_codon:yes gene_type:complete